MSSLTPYFKKNKNILNMSHKRTNLDDEYRNEFNRGYNKAIDQCNRKALFIAQKLFEAYKSAHNYDEDYDDEEDEEE